MRTLSDLLTEIPRYQSGGDVDVVRRAYEFTREVHQGQRRVSGEPYDIHPLAVAGLLVEFKMDATTVAAGLLHDVLEDTATSKDVLGGAVRGRHRGAGRRRHQDREAGLRQP
jgi:GTP pyrophosphokinase